MAGRCSCRAAYLMPRQVGGGSLASSQGGVSACPPLSQRTSAHPGPAKLSTVQRAPVGAWRTRLPARIVVPSSRRRLRGGVHTGMSSSGGGVGSICAVLSWVGPRMIFAAGDNVRPRAQSPRGGRAGRRHRAAPRRACAQWPRRGRRRARTRRRDARLCRWRPAIRTRRTCTPLVAAGASNEATPHACAVVNPVLDVPGVSGRGDVGECGGGVMHWGCPFDWSETCPGKSHPMRGLLHAYCVAVGKWL